MKIFPAVLLVACVCAGAAHGAIILTNDWESGAEGWNTRVDVGPASTLTDPQAGLGGETALKIEGGANPGEPVSYIYNNTTLAGNFDYTSLGTNILSFSFDFYAETTTPGALQVYFYNSTQDTEWYYTISSNDLSVGWSTYTLNFWTSDGWYNPDYALGGSQAQLDADLTDVDEIGLLLSYQPNLANQVYGTDDWLMNNEYYIPEPETYAMLGFVFLSLAITFRKDLNKQLERALAAVRVSRQS